MLQRSFLHPWEGTLTSFTAVGIKYNCIDVHITCPAMFTLPVLPCSHYLYCHVHITCTAMFMQASPVPKGIVQAVCVFWQ